MVVHGGDFVFEGPSDAFAQIVVDLKKHWIIKTRAVLGPDAGDDKEVSILNRIVRWCTSASSMRPIRGTSRNCFVT